MSTLSIKEPIITYSYEAYNQKYADLYYALSQSDENGNSVITDQDIAEWKDYFSFYTKTGNDYFGIGLQVCEDIIAERKASKIKG